MVYIFLFVLEALASLISSLRGGYPIYNLNWLIVLPQIKFIHSNPCGRLVEANVR